MNILKSKNKGFTLHLLKRKKEGIFPKFFKKGEGFTLIETLIVIAIIGILASVVAVAVTGVREKARIVGGLQFSQSVHNALGVDAVGVWSFDENADDTCQGATSPYNDICDSSGNNNHGQRSGAIWTSEGNTPSGKGYALSFNGVNNYVDAGNRSTLQFNIALTIEAWINQASSPTNVRSIVTKGDSTWEFFVDTTNVIRLRMATVGGWDLYGRTTLSPGKWFHVVGTYDSVAQQANVYVNGVLENSATRTGIIANPTFRNVMIGVRSGPATLPFYGLIDEVRIYSRALTSAQIQEHYAEGAKKRGLLASPVKKAGAF